LLKRALAKKTVDRIQSAKAFREELIALTGVGDTMSRLNATVQLGGSASSVNAQTIQSGLKPTTTQTFFGGNTMMRLARYRRSKIVLGLGGAFALSAIVLSAWLLIGRGDGAEAKVASNDQPVGEVVSGALTPSAPPVAPQPAAPVATNPPANVGSAPNTAQTQTQVPLETQTVTAPVTQGVPVDPNAPTASQGQMPSAGQTLVGVAPVPGAQPVGESSQLNASVVPGVAPAPGTAPMTAEANPQGATVPVPGTDPGSQPAPTAEQVPPTMVASTQPNALTPTGMPVVVEGATVQSPEELKTYTVKSGDTLSKIAKANNITVDDLRWWNDILNPYSLKVGQDLKLFAAADIKPKEQFLSEATAAEKARKEAAATKAAESGTAAPQESAPSNSGGTLEGQFKGNPVGPATPPAKKPEEKKPKRGFFKGIFNR
jgi:LysM repeat protein